MKHSFINSNHEKLNETKCTLAASFFFLCAFEKGKKNEMKGNKEKNRKKIIRVDFSDDENSAQREFNCYSMCSLKITSYISNENVNLIIRCTLALN